MRTRACVLLSAVVGAGLLFGLQPVAKTETVDRFLTGARQAAGEMRISGSVQHRLLQGLKPSLPFHDFVGPTKVVPLLQSVEDRGTMNLSESWKAPFLLSIAYGTAEAVPFQNATFTTGSQGACTPPDSMKVQLEGTPSAAALNELGLWYAENSQYACAAGAFGSSLQADPKQKDVAHITFMFGVSMDLSGDSKGAIGALKEAEQRGYRDIKLHLMLAATLDATHSAKEAEDEWRAALQMDPEYTAALDALSNDLLRDGDFAGVIALLEAPRLKGQRTALQSLNLAAAYEGSGKLEEARDVLRDGLNTSPDSLPLANELAKMLVALSDKAGAGTVLYLAGVQQMSKGALEEARGLFERAVGLGDSSADLQDALIKAKAAQAGK